MISHDINIAAKYADKIIMMNEGTIYAVGTPEEVINEENLKTVYGVRSCIIFDEGRPHVILRDAIPLKSNRTDECSGTEISNTSIAVEKEIA